MKNHEFELNVNVLLIFTYKKNKLFIVCVVDFIIMSCVMVCKFLLPWLVAVEELGDSMYYLIGRI